MTDNSRLDIPRELAASLIRQQFPQWADLDVRPVERSGWDNATFRLGDTMKVRLPRAACYEASIKIENDVLPRLAPFMTCAIPEPLELGRPSDRYPLQWSIQNWLEGAPPRFQDLTNADLFAKTLANNLAEMQQLDAGDGPAPSVSNFYRGGDLAVYQSDVTECVSILVPEVDVRSINRVWQSALETTFTGPPRWVHGDVAVGNLLAIDGRLSAMIDFGAIAAGDPACDLVIAWTFFQGSSRQIFVETINARGHLDKNVWQRARGWALWKALFVCTHKTEIHPNERPARDVIKTLIDEDANSSS